MSAIPFLILQTLPAATAGYGVIVIVLALASLAMLFVSRYKRCPANKVLIISGKVGAGRSARVLNGGGAFVMPVLQEYAFLSLAPFQIKIDLNDALSLENIRVKVPTQVTVAIGDTPEYHQNAAARLLGSSLQEISALAENITFGQMRQVIASMKIEDINRDREQFRKHLENALEPELMKVGLKLFNVNIKDLSDESGYIEAIGREAGARAVQKARGDVAEQEKLGETRVAQAAQEQAVAVAAAHREREIGVKTAERDTAVKVAELDKETAVAQKQAEFLREQAVATADQTRRVAVAGANAEAIQGETTAQARVAAAQAELAVKQAEAFQTAETRKRVAEAAVQEAENRARAQAAIAQAERIEAEQRAAVEAPAKADKARIIVEAEAAGEQRKIAALADAQAIYARLEAEARGNYEILAKKAEGIRKLVEAAGGAEQAYQLLMLEHVDTLADKAAEAVKAIKIDKVVMWGGAGANGDGSSGVGNFVKELGSVLPPMLDVMKNVGGVQMGRRFVDVNPEGLRAEPVVADVAAEAAAAAPHPGKR